MSLTTGLALPSSHISTFLANDVFASTHGTGDSTSSVDGLRQERRRLGDPLPVRQAASLVSNLAMAYDRRFDRSHSLTAS